MDHRDSMITLPATAPGGWRNMVAWFDIDNPPQAMYLIPIKRYLDQQGTATVVTARDCGITQELLALHGQQFISVGSEFGTSRIRKIGGTVLRALNLRFAVRPYQPAVCISSSRASALAAYSLRIPAFIFCDYEFAELGSYRKLGAYIVHPEAMGREPFMRRGFSSARLIEYPGIKEAITFAGVHFEAHPTVAGIYQNAGTVNILYRPPGYKGHYFSEQSGEFETELLHFLSRHEGVTMVFTPRYPEQIPRFLSFPWKNEPRVIQGAENNISLLRSVDLVICSGGTMLREAAFWGIPAYSIFRSAIGSVDRFLEKEGRLRIIASVQDFSSIRLEKRSAAPIPLMQSDVIPSLSSNILAQVPYAHRSKSVSV